MKYFAVHTQAYPLLPISNAEFDEITKRLTDKGLPLPSGCPLYRSEDGRLFPIPGDDWTVEEME